jgi:ABC-2 type transport system permease protein
MKGTFAWSVRRELWEHRGLWIAPLAVSVLIVVAFFLGVANGHFEKTGSLATLPLEKQRMIVMMPFNLAATVVLVVSFLAAAFYCLDALNAERRDRSILFWKSMPVSDRTTVLSKAFVSLAVAPAIGLVVALATQLLLLVLGSAILGAKGIDVGEIAGKLPLGSAAVSMVYGVIVHALWYAPLFALFLVASVATRRPILWVIVPPIVVQVLERIAFGTQFTGEFLKWRLMGAMSEAFQRGAGDSGPIASLSQLDPGRFLASPGLWLGLVAAGVFLFIAIRIRRFKEPL